jgi:hypothetical protein
MAGEKKVIARLNPPRCRTEESENEPEDVFVSYQNA